MQLKPWMVNANMWASGMKVNKWKVPESWLMLGWFAERNPFKWNEHQLMYFDYTCAMMAQKDTGWN